MNLISILSLPFSYIPHSLLPWLAIFFFIILSFPILLSIFLWLFLKKYKFRIWPISFFCYSHIKFIIDVSPYISLVIAIRHISINWHKSKPFISFRLRGVSIYIIQHNFFKDPNISQYVNDLKARFLLGIRKKSENIPILPVPLVPSPIPAQDKNSNSLFDLINGIAEEIDMQILNVKSEQEKRNAIRRCYSGVYKQKTKNLEGTFNIYMPIGNIAFMYKQENGLSFAMNIPQFELIYKKSEQINILNNIEITINTKNNISVLVDIKSADIKLRASELNKLIYTICDYLYLGYIYEAYDKFTLKDKYLNYGYKPLNSNEKFLEKLIIKTGNIQGKIYGSIFNKKQPIEKHYKFPENDLDIFMPNFLYSYEYKPEIEVY